MKSTKSVQPELAESEIVIKLLKCPICKGMVRAAVKHLMETKDKNSFAKEALEYNLEVTEMPILDYRKGIDYCSCSEK